MEGQSKNISDNNVIFSVLHSIVKCYINMHAEVRIIHV